MLKCARIFPRPFPLGVWLFVTTAAVGMSQESATPPKAESEIPKASSTEVAPSENAAKRDASKPESSTTLEGLVNEMPPWATEFKDGNFEDYVPALTEPYDSYNEAKAEIDRAIRKAFAEHLHRNLGDLALSYRLTPIASELRKKFAFSSPWAVVKSTKDGKDSFIGAIRLDIPDHEIKFIIENYNRRTQQFSAIQQTIMVGAGALGVVSIFALSARLDHAFGGKRSGILRAASLIAILSLLGSITMAAVLGLVSTS